jgi:hypothetical protein
VPVSIPSIYNWYFTSTVKITINIKRVSARSNVSNAKNACGTFIITMHCLLFNIIHNEFMIKCSLYIYICQISIMVRLHYFNASSFSPHKCNIQ